MQRLSAVVIGGVVGLWAASAQAQAGGVSQTVGHGQINWSDKTITATGSGAPSLKAANVAVARLGAERAAKLDALRNILEAVKGVQVSGGESAGAKMSASPELEAKVEGIVRNFKVLDTKYYSDGGVDLVVQVPLDGVLTATLLPEAGSQAPKETKVAGDAGGITGVIINAKGLDLTPALAPKVLDAAGKSVYSADIVARDAVERRGVAGYSSSLESAMKDKRVADKPLIVRATKAASRGGSDIVVGSEDAVKLAKLSPVLADAKVIIVVD